MILFWMAYASASAALMGAAAACVERLVASRGSARRWVWLGGIAASVVAPAMLPFVRARVAPAISPGIVATAVASVGTPPSARLDLVVLSAWALASLMLVAVLAAAHWRTRRMLRDCRRATIAGHETLVSLNFGPALVGAFRARIVVPAWTLSLSDEEQRLVVTHEVEHARSRDPLLALAALGAVAAMPWNPGVWWLFSRLRLAIELDCDARVVAQLHGGAVAYGQLLLHVRERDRATRQPLLALSHSRSSLAKRLDALLFRNTSRFGHMVGLAALGACMVAAVGFLPAPRVDTAISALLAGRESTPVAHAAFLPPAARRDSAVATMQAAPTPSHAAMIARPTRFRSTGGPSEARKVVFDADAVPPIVVVPSNPVAQITVAPANLPVSARAGMIVVRSGSFGAAAGTSPTAARATAGGIVRPAAPGIAPPVAAGGFVRAMPRSSAGTADTTRPPPRQPPR